MKKVCMIFLFIFSMSIFLIGCNAEKKEVKAEFDTEKVQKIEVSSVENPEQILHVMETKKDMKEFTETLQIDKWDTATIPSDAVEEYTYKLYQEDTIKLGESKADKRELKHVGTIITYKNSPYIQLKSKKLTFNFKVPKDVTEQLSNDVWTSKE
ncbi:hypothetical protein BAMA_20815 [Bacillus manliponensis]|uniref:Lipoprotein n=1 Tax=Bacillus manliponensis TaxID=574376 RepID=A0A073JZG9_9BACI|nr:hypothetical protein [Bacillus manliponensis]KEK19691.1 hypothetical protein BAMA_20815 [Bacillus manliponensis]